MLLVLSLYISVLKVLGFSLPNGLVVFCIILIYYKLILLNGIVRLGLFWLSLVWTNINENSLKHAKRAQSVYVVCAVRYEADSNLGSSNEWMNKWVMPLFKFEYFGEVMAIRLQTLGPLDNSTFYQ